MPLAQDGALVVLEVESPHDLARLGQFSDEVAGLDVPQLDSSIVSGRYDESVIELKAGDRVVVGADPLQAGVCCQVEDDDSTVRTACDQDIAGELQLANERCVSLEKCDTFTRVH